MRALPRLLLLCLALGGATHVVASTARAVDWPGKVPSKAERGQELFERHCVACHGAQAKGDGPLAASLLVPVPDLSAGLQGRDRRELVQLVLRGRGAHPSFEQSFRDLKPFQSDTREDAEAALDHLERAGSAPPPEEAPPEPPEGEDEEQDQGPKE